VVRRLRAKTLGYLCLSVIAGLFVIRNLRFVLHLSDRWPESVYRLTFFRIDTLCAGALLAIAVQQWPHLVERRNYLRIICAASGCLFLYAAFGRLYMAPTVIRYGYTSMVLFSTSLIALALFPGSFTARVFSNPFLRKLGKYSYCFYLIHPFLVNYVASRRADIDRIVNPVAGRWMSHNLISVALASLDFGVIFAVCAISWKFFEGPIHRLKRHFRYTPAPEHHLA
jgi:peptidoglycan/LPS O-acetylase OafA/YrhL